MKLSRIATIAASSAALTLAACGSNVQDPQLAMCQAVAKQLTDNSVAGWERTDQSDRARSRQITIDFSTVSDGSGSIRCNYPIDENGTVASAPDTVRLNGDNVPQRTLLSAGVAASKELLAGTAAETAERARELADQAGEKASEVASQVSDKASEVAGQASEVAGQVGDKAREVAGQAVGSAVEAGQALQEKLEN